MNIVSLDKTAKHTVINPKGKRPCFLTFVLVLGNSENGIVCMMSWPKILRRETKREREFGFDEIS